MKNSENQNILKNDLFKYTKVELIPDNNCYMNQTCNNQILSTQKVIKSFQAFLFQPKIEKVFPNALSESYRFNKSIFKKCSKLILVVNYLMF